MNFRTTVGIPIRVMPPKNIAKPSSNLACVGIIVKLLTSDLLNWSCSKIEEIAIRQSYGLLTNFFQTSISGSES
jgi:hypothetical protein